MHIPRKKTLVMMIMALSWLLANMVFNVANAQTREKTILSFGDSLMAGYGIPYAEAFPAQLEKKLQAEGYSVRVINAGVSGDTTSGGLTRLAWVLDQQKPDFVILELGANDMLRAIDPKVTRDNLQKMLEILQQRKIPVLLAGMKAAPNLGGSFTKNYPKMYEDLSRKFHTGYYPFFMEGVTFHSDLILEDGLHPNPSGIAVIVEGILPQVKKMLDAQK